MGASDSKKRRKPCHGRRNLTDKMRFPHENIEREAALVFAWKEAEWVKERKKLTEEVKVLRRLAAEQEEKMKEMVVVGKCDNGWPLLGTSYLLDQMQEDRARRDEVVEKWKQLYLDIRTELDDLIQRTHGEAIHSKADEDELIEEMKKELKSKDETIEALRARIASMAKEGLERKRDMDILKQSLRILDSKMKTAYTSRNNTVKTLGQYL